MSKKKLTPEIRSFNEFKRVDSGGEEESRTIEGYAAVFNKRSELLWENGEVFYEIIERGAFDNVMQNDVRALFNHDPNILLARTKSGTLKLEQDDTGLKFRFDMPKSRNEILESVERGDLDQNSFAFYIDTDEWNKEGGDLVRTIKKVKSVRDITLATYPAYPDTTAYVAARSSFDKWEKENKDAEETNEDYNVKYRERALQLSAHNN